MNGSLIARYIYDTWGNTLSIVDASGNEITNSTALPVQNQFRYRGYYYDNESGLYYLQSRYYDPVTCRFVNADGQVSGVGGTLLGYNLFAYCFNNPVNINDNEGEWPQWAKEITSRLVHTAKFMAGTVMAFAKSIKGSLGGGVGIGINASAKINGVDIAVGASYTITDSVTYSKGSFSSKNSTALKAEVSFLGIINHSKSRAMEYSYSNSKCNCNPWKDSFKKKSECVANIDTKENDDMLGVSIGAYFGIGFEASVGIDLKTLNDELHIVFHESLNYGK